MRLNDSDRSADDEGLDHGAYRSRKLRVCRIIVGLRAKVSIKDPKYSTERFGNEDYSLSLSLSAEWHSRGVNSISITQKRSSSK